MKKESLSKFTNQCAKKLNETGKFSTARAYNSALRSFSLFVGKEEVFFRDVNRFTLKAYNNSLFIQGHKPNTVSTYMRTLRSIYNQGVDLGLAEPVARLFHDVYTGIDVNCKKAISPQDMHTLLYKHPGDEKLKRVQEIAKLMFDFSGISFADIANLKTTNFRGNVLEYSRKKTRTRISLQLLPSSKPLMSQLKMQDAGNSNLFEFSILSGQYGTDTYDGYQEYQSKTPLVQCQAEEAGAGAWPFMPRLVLYHTPHLGYHSQTPGHAHRDDQRVIGAQVNQDHADIPQEFRPGTTGRSELPQLTICKEYRLIFCRYFLSNSRCILVAKIDIYLISSKQNTYFLS
jgi:hypothetical protein